MKTLERGDCLTILKTLPQNSVDSIVTDPPYGLAFMGKSWDYNVPSVEIWRECLRVLKPGGHLLAFGGTRTYHRLVVAIEDAGFEIRDQIQWIYGQGFPKSQDISKAIDKAAGAEGPIVGKNPAYRERQLEHDAQWETAMRPEFKRGPATTEAKQWSGWGSALKPANEPICLARKPLSESTIAKNVLKHGTGGLNIDATRIPGHNPSIDRRETARKTRVSPGNPGEYGSTINDRTSFESYTSDHSSEHLGRFPANVLFDEDAANVLDGQSGVSKSCGGKKAINIKTNFGQTSGRDQIPFGYEDIGGASRFFYVAKASKSDRGEGNTHPTVKPIKLMEYLIKLITPPNGIVLDPFMGSGSTGVAAVKNRFKFVGIEISEEYFKIAQKRIST